MEICTVIALWADSVSGELFTFALVTQIEGMRKFTGLPLFTQTALVMFANQMPNS